MVNKTLRELVREHDSYVVRDQEIKALLSKLEMEHIEVKLKKVKAQRALAQELSLFLKDGNDMTILEVEK